MTTTALRSPRAPGVVLSPRVGGVTRETPVRIALAAGQNVAGRPAGDPHLDVVN
ncbi:hypothetical protein HLK59_07260 [Streptomyces sp. S3(2020)]|uniref:hypothetical protein n=1 Tax=Streptomyces sp. S3(2020) TaxID=2732044 RepID=UPI00148812DA|nr:hypothetical protein [Streptomyces sp. S3(2020)]NNN30162.1 hypothetical protein [Streptomyces sp. S3(2020)]